MRRLTVILVIPALLLLAACAPGGPSASDPGSQPDPSVVVTVSPSSSETPSADAPPPPPPAPASKLPAATAVDPALFIVPGFFWQSPEFISPSGNISCGIHGSTSAAENPYRVACAVNQHSWEYPPCTDEVCGAMTIIDTAGAVGVFRRGGAELAGEATGVAPRTLQYGESVTWDTITCVATPDGIFCEDSSTGHGFALSKSTYDTY